MIWHFLNTEYPLRRHRDYGPRLRQWSPFGMLREQHMQLCNKHKRIERFVSPLSSRQHFWSELCPLHLDLEQKESLISFYMEFINLQLRTVLLKLWWWCWWGLLSTKAGLVFAIVSLLTVTLLHGELGFLQHVLRDALSEQEAHSLYPNINYRSKIWQRMTCWYHRWLWTISGLAFSALLRFWPMCTFPGSYPWTGLSKMQIVCNVRRGGTCTLGCKPCFKGACYLSQFDVLVLINKKS